jgi:hypothetical protein
MIDMNRIASFMRVFILAALAAGCRRPVPYAGPEIKKPVVQVLSKYPAGDDLQGLIDDFNLDGAAVRYRDVRVAGRISAVYFLEKGNLHVEAQAAADGRNRFLAVPYFEPADGTVGERVAKWDGALEPPSYPDRKY